jgi:trypsin
MLSLLKFFLISLLLEDCLSFPRNDGRIVGGKTIPLSNAPYQTSLEFRNQPFCGGSIISTSFILTAAHCTDDKSPSSLSVRLGTDRLGTGGEVIAVRSVTIHPRFNMNTIDYDFSLLKLAKLITLQQRVKEVIALAPMNDELVDGSRAFVSGWGDTRNKAESRFYLRGAEISIIGRSTCKRAYSFLTPQMVCAGRLSGGIDACQVSIWKTLHRAKFTVQFFGF